MAKLYTLDFYYLHDHLVAGHNETYRQIFKDFFENLAASPKDWEIEMIYEVLG